MLMEHTPDTARPEQTRHVEVVDPNTAGRLGFWAALGTAATTNVTFALALTAIPDAGPHCQTDCVSYPFTDERIAEQWPGDYLWMFPAMLMTLLFVAMLVAIHECAPRSHRIYSLLAICIAVIAAAVLLIDYFIQVTVMQPSLSAGQLEGWAMLTQYNSRGVFIALEELGYLLMGLSMFLVGQVFIGHTRRERGIRWLFTLSFAAIVAVLVAVSLSRGANREDIFEVYVISIVWLTLIIGSPLVAFVMRDNRKAQPVDPQTGHPVSTSQDES